MRWYIRGQLTMEEWHLELVHDGACALIQLKDGSRFFIPVRSGFVRF